MTNTENRMTKKARTSMERVEVWRERRHYDLVIFPKSVIRDPSLS